MIRPVVLYGDEILRQKSVEIPQKNSFKISDIITDLFDTVHKAAGAGLSGVQISLLLKIFVIDAEIKSENFKFKGVFINPVIRKRWGQKVKFTEGCLSIPQVTALVERSDKIELEWYDENWKERRQKFSGFASRIIQHEYDHLEGILYIDHLDYMWQEILKDPLEIIKTKKFEGLPYLWR